MKPLASIGCDMPVELLAATGRYAGPLGYDPDRPTPRAERWLESKFAPWAFQILEDWAAGALDHLEAVVFSRGDDSAHRLYYYVCELQRLGEIAGPEPIVVDVAHIPRATSLDRSVDALRRLAERLGVSEQMLADAMQAAAPSPATRSSRPACLIAGTLPPDRRLHEIIEGAGWAAHGETLAESWLARAPATEGEARDSFERLGHRLHTSVSGPRAFHDWIGALLSQVEALPADAVLLWFCEHDEAGAWHAPAMRNALVARGLPHLFLTRRDWAAKDGVAGEIGAFLARSWP